jgi:hypothetical protein
MSEFASAAAGWEEQFTALLPLYGHRNWIVVADSAYPAQTRAGIETVVAGEDQVSVLGKVAAAIRSSRHIRADVYLDEELSFVPEGEAPGVANYREALNGLLANCVVRRLSHEEIISKLDHAAQLFRVLIIKTDMTIPYTSVFFELDCGYWSAEAEQRLREAVAKAGTK